MSHQKSGKVNSPNIKSTMPPLNKTGGQYNAEYEEAMDVEQPVAANVLNSNDRQEADSPPLFMNQNQEDRLQNWFNSPGHDTACEQPEAVMETYDDGDEASATGVVEARFENVLHYKQTGKTDTRLYGEAKTIRCLPWKILAIFHPIDSSTMGFFVQCNGDSESQTWSCSAKATLVLVAQQPNCKDKEMKIQHTFTHKENDWGFQNFIPYDDLFNPDNGFVAMRDGVDSILLRAHVKADAPHGADWDSKRHTGFVGLKNQGATCYLNSLLQALYCTNKLRRAVFLMPTESDDAQTSVPLALQRVFYELQFSDRAVGTKKLTRSFGWATLDSFMQHDAQELCRVLLDNLENKMKGTSVEDVIPGLFCGRMLSYIRCLNVRYESKREEKFYDIQLKVNGNRTIYDAFEEYVAKETLTQDNKYDAGEYGLQEAEKGVIFIRFPPVLYLQLMRFQYDFVADTNVKINDYFKFMSTLELDRFLLQPDPNAPANYFLHAVLVHSGDNHAGHYVVYINPAGNNVWYQFDDDVVSRCSVRDAIDMNFGGNEDPEMRPCTNAYMLVYISESAKSDVLCPVSISDIPESLRERFLEEQNLEEAKRLEKERGHLYMVVYLVLEEDFYGWQGPELCCQEQLPNRMLRIPKQTTRIQLVEAVAKVLNCSMDLIKLWHFRPRKKNIPTHLLELGDNPLQYNPKDIHIFFVQYQSSPMTSHVSTPRRWEHSPGADIDPNRGDKRLFFVKYFDPKSWTMSFCGHVELRGDEPLSAMEPVLRERAGLPSNCDLQFFQDDAKTGISEISQPKLPVSKLFKREHQGHLIYFQVTLSSLISAAASTEIGTEALSSMADDEHAIAVKISTEIPEADPVNGLPSVECDLIDDNTGRTALTNTPKCVTAGPDAMVLHRMATLPDSVNLKCTALGNNQGRTPQKPHSVHCQQHALASDVLSIFNYFSNYPQQTDILLVDKMRPSDPGILLRVAADLTYWEFANVAALHLSTSSDHLQFFRSQQSIGVVPSSVTAPMSVSPLGTTGSSIVGSDMVGSQVSSDLVAGANTAGCLDNGSGAIVQNILLDSSLTPQAVAAKAAGFAHGSTYMNGLLAAAASQGLAHEPPGAAIPSTHIGSMRDFFFSLTVSPTNSSWASDPAVLGGNLIAGTGNLGANAVGANAQNPDRFPVPINRYCGVKSVNRSPVGSVTFPPPRRVYYAHLAIRIDELETMRQIRAVYIGPKLVPKAELLLSVPQNGLVSDLLKEAIRHLILPPDGSGQLRLLEISANRILQEYHPETKLSSIPQTTAFPQSCAPNPVARTLRIEEIPVDEVNLRPDEIIVYVSHFEKDLVDTFGIPFTVRIRDGEHYSEVRERIRRKLEVPEKEFERWRFALVHPAKATYIPNDEDPIIFTSVFTQAYPPETKPWLGIEHKPSKRPRYAPNEKPIKIHN
ncbi:Ubiquitin carboxyl-terminal hydrolase 7 [Fasciola gigantica]|uniref:Ubiquitin carboxyl-terminal hydrolase 7 n=1 Tax=Fasciola gigantica TaxID=46835 RepID=A0A504YL48_FASGI|nr:Ubiquitin carboxyl-terminal hydrolase 7 [Fasciola gigantica]